MTERRALSEPHQQQKKWYAKTPYQVLLFVVGIVLFVFVVGWILDWYIEPKTSGQKKDLVQALGLITAGVAGAVGIYFTWHGQRLTQLAQEDSRTQAQRTLKLTEQGQITDRFTKAIEQLGGGEGEQKRVEIQLGGIHALERIASESEKDYWPIMEIAASYIRQYAPREYGTDFDSDTDLGLGHADPVIQTVVSLIASRSGEWGREEGGRIDLERTDLRNSAWRSYGNVGANLTGVWLHEADLRGANLRGANLRDAWFGRADLSYTYLGDSLTAGDVNFEEATLVDAMLPGADLRHAQNLTQDQIDQAVGDNETLLPPDLKHPPHWSVQLEEQTEED